MVVDNRRLLHVERRDVKEDVIDLGAPRPDLSAPRLRNYAQNLGGAHNLHLIAESKKNPLGTFDNGINFGGSPNKASARRQPGRRHASVLYTPNPRLSYQPGPTGGKSTRSPKKKAEVNKRAHHRVETVNRVQRRKRKTRRYYLPNPRLYQPPPNRPRVPPIPPLCPRAAWSPPPKSAPLQTASEIALQFSERHIIPFRELLPAAIKPGCPVIKPGNSQLNPFPTPRDKLWELVAEHTGRDLPGIASAREKKQSSKSPPDSPRQTTRDKTHTRKSSPTRSRLSSAKDKKLRVAKERTVSRVTKIQSGSSLEPQEEPTLVSIPPIPNYVNAPPKRYKPRSQHFRLRTLDSNSSTSSPPPATQVLNPSPAARLPEIKMAASPHSSITPEEVSDGNDSISSAPSEYLAEFLSAIMSRKYAEALKYCRLILHYEPQNATARGFYPLLRYKLGQTESPLSHGSKYDGKVLGSSNSEGSSSGAGADARSEASPDGVEDLEERSDSEAESVASLSLDSSGKSSRSASPAARGTDSASECSGEILGVTAADVTAIGSNWLTDDNGNPHSESNKHNLHGDDKDDENDNTGSGDHKLLLKDPALRQLRAQFACSIK